MHEWDVYQIPKVEFSKAKLRSLDIPYPHTVCGMYNVCSNSCTNEWKIVFGII